MVTLKESVALPGNLYVHPIYSLTLVSMYHKKNAKLTYEYTSPPMNMEILGPMTATIGAAIQLAKAKTK